jgi:hypothetical protein
MTTNTVSLSQITTFNSSRVELKIPKMHMKRNGLKFLKSVPVIHDFLKVLTAKI